MGEKTTTQVLFLNPIGNWRTTIKSDICIHPPKKESVNSCESRDRAGLIHVCRVKRWTSLPIRYLFVKQCSIEETLLVFYWYSFYVFILVYFCSSTICYQSTVFFCSYMSLMILKFPHFPISKVSFLLPPGPPRTMIWMPCWKALTTMSCHRSPRRKCRTCLRQRQARQKLGRWFSQEVNTKEI